jgi:Domain of unknown function (DUF4232)
MRVSVLAAVAVAAVVAVTSTGASAQSASPAAPPRCKTADLEIWLGLGEGGGTAGSVYYPLEFSNVSHRVCALNGFPGVSAVGNRGGQIGPGASRNGQSHGTVILGRGATGHAILRVLDAGAVCSSPVTATSLKVFPPGATKAQSIDFSFAACRNKGVLIVGPVRAGVGIPGFTTS